MITSPELVMHPSFEQEENHNGSISEMASTIFSRVINRFRSGNGQCDGKDKGVDGDAPDFRADNKEIEFSHGFFDQR
jgi:hypothetical protein